MGKGKLPPGFSAYPRYMGAGFSYRADGYAGEVAPTKGSRTELVRWRGVLWRDGDVDRTPLVVVEDETHWGVAEAIVEECRTLARTRR